jgi:hypothetical protein
MTLFLNTTGVSYHLEEMMKGTKDRLILVSPYLQFADRIKEHLYNLNSRKCDIRIIYRENKLQIEDNNWLESQIGIRTSLCKNLHAKCYINENAAIITSMNLYAFSQLNNNEIGVFISKIEDEQLYNSTVEEVQRLLTISEEIRVSVKKVPVEQKSKTSKAVDSQIQIGNKQKAKLSGYCIRTGVSIPFNIEKPLCYNAFKSWNIYGDPDYPEKFCHFSGEESDGKTSVSRPILKKNWTKAKELLDV